MKDFFNDPVHLITAIGVITSLFHKLFGILNVLDNKKISDIDVLLDSQEIDTGTKAYFEEKKAQLVYMMNLKLPLYNKKKRLIVSELVEGARGRLNHDSFKKADMYFSVDKYSRPIAKFNFSLCGYWIGLSLLCLVWITVDLLSLYGLSRITMSEHKNAFLIIYFVFLFGSVMLVNYSLTLKKHITNFFLIKREILRQYENKNH